MPRAATAPDAPTAARRALERRFAACGLERPFHRAAYDPGDRLEYEVTGVVPARRGRVVAEVERFVGGGFAGQVYRVRLLEVEGEEGPIAGLEVGARYAVKILIPPSAFSRWFRNLLYRLGYQCHFGAQALPAAVRTGVLWQKLIRRAMALETGDERSVCDTHATFFDAELGSHGEINEWIDGRIWAFEADDRLLSRWAFRGRPPADHNSPEYVAKKLFMRRLVALLHEIGAAELARQYEWGTCKSQPNVLKRLDAGDAPAAGLTAVDFRAGLTLLFILPMSPADFWLILRGLARGRLVQFDRCDTGRLRRFAAARGGFEDLEPAIDELERQDRAYRQAQPELTRNLIRLLFDGDKRRAVREGAITAWRSLGRLDERHEQRLRDGKAPFAPLYVLSAIPLLGPRLVGLWGSDRRRRHARKLATSFDYLGRALRGARVEALVAWTRQGRVDPERALRLVDRPLRFFAERVLFGLLPASWHRLLAEPAWARARLRASLRYALDFLRRPEFREQVLLDQVRLGREEGMLSDAEAARIEGQIKDPFIQKYLRCLAVHVCTVPVTQVFMVLASAAVAVYCLVYRGLSWPESMGYAAATAAAIQLLPISPGSITRGVFVLFLMVRERDLRNYWLAAPISFLHVIGYLAFPLQMVTQNPALARFLAGRWTRRMANLVPVFGERGALAEHAVFDLFFNLPISLARGLRQRPLHWAAGIVFTVATVAVALLGVVGLGWEAWQPEVEVGGARIVSARTYHDRGGDLGWVRRVTRSRLEGVDAAVLFAARRWDPSLHPGQIVAARVRRSFWGGGYDGLAIAAVAEPEPDAPPAAEPAAAAEIFARGVVSTPAPEFATAFTPDGGRVFFNRASADRGSLTMLVADRDGDGWREEGELPFAGEFRDVDPFVTTDGSRLYFSSDRPAAGEQAAGDFDVWYVERRGDGWGEPRRLGEPVNSPATEVFATLAASGAIYFGSNRDGVFDIYRAAATGDGWGAPERLGLAADEESSVGNPWIAADESFLLFSSGRPGGLGGSDLWISFRRGGEWTAPVNPGPAVNSPQADFAPALSPDERHLYFTSERPGVVPEGAVEGRPPGDIYRIELAPILDPLRPPDG